MERTYHTVAIDTELVYTLKAVAVQKRMKLKEIIELAVTEYLKKESN